MREIASWIWTTIAVIAFVITCFELGTGNVESFKASLTVFLIATALVYVNDMFWR